MSPGPAGDRGGGLTTRLVRVLLIGLMAIGSVALWIGVPLFWLWLGSQLSDSSQPSLGLYVLVLVAIPATMFVVGKGLGWLDALYAQSTGTLPAKRLQTPWLTSLRGDRSVERRSTVLAPVMVTSVTVALVLFAIWFLVFARGGGLPSGG